VVVLASAAILLVQILPAATAAASVPMITAIAPGYGHTCALTDAGGVKCWGDNELGQLGNGTTIDSLVAVDVAGLASGVSAITAGSNHTCALTREGGVKCWGHYPSGQLGDGASTNSLAPVDVPGLTSDVIAVAAGGFHTCVLTTAGGIECWGEGTNGQLGDGSTTNSTVPVDVADLQTDITAMAAGSFHSCALTGGGGVKCWGLNSSGQLGYGATPQPGGSVPVPVDVSGLASGITAIAGGGFHTCVLTSGGGVKCWGDNQAGQLGDGTTTNSGVPVDVLGVPSGATALAVGGLHACALTGGGVKCWGSNFVGELGNGTTTNSSDPVVVAGLASGVVAIAVRDFHTCALTTDGRVKCWGQNLAGQLGDGTTINSSVPVDLAFASQEPPQTDRADPGAHKRVADFPRFPLLAGLAAGIVMLVRRRTKVADDRV
jgi:alpha-tubulin suppressor-like RCC1 family protein